MDIVNPQPYNPLDKENLGISVREALLRQRPMALDRMLLVGKKHQDFKFYGAGIYAIYYVGAFPPYQSITNSNQQFEFNSPIYVGKAVPKGSRKGGIVKSEKPSDSLFLRLREHARGIQSVGNLKIEDFHFRYLVVDDIWIPLGETYMIETFRPIWNYIVAGFGIKTPGKRRKDQQTSLWDTLHPGRQFVTRLGLPANPKTADQIASEVIGFFTLPPEEKAQLIATDDGEE